MTIKLKGLDRLTADFLPTDTPTKGRYLAQLGSLKWAAEEAKAKLDEVKKLALQEAIQIWEANDGKAATVFREEGVQVQLRYKAPNEKNNQTLETLKELLDNEKQAWRRKYSKRSQAFEERRVALQAEIDALEAEEILFLRENPTYVELENEWREVLADPEQKVPEIAIILK